jgi:hypothetical protein
MTNQQILEIIGEGQGPITPKAHGGCNGAYPSMKR